MREIDLQKLREQYRGSRYADLVGYHLKRQSQRERLAGIRAVIEELALPIQSAAESFLDRWNAAGYDQDFWQRDTADVFDEITDDARQLISNTGLTPDDRTVFDLFNLVTMNYAYSAADQPKMHEFMGIKHPSRAIGESQRSVGHGGTSGDGTAARVTKVAGLVLKTVLSDEPWQDLGFSRRPRYGTVVQRLRPQWRVRLEKAIVREMMALFSIAYVQAGVLVWDDIPQLLQMLVDGPGDAQLWRTYGYESRAEALDDLRSAIQEYTGDPKRWPRTMISRLGLSALPDRSTAARLVAGVVRFTRTTELMMLHLSPGHGTHGTAGRP